MQSDELDKWVNRGVEAFKALERLTPKLKRALQEYRHSVATLAGCDISDWTWQDVDRYYKLARREFGLDLEVVFEYPVIYYRQKEGGKLKGF